MPLTLFTKTKSLMIKGGGGENPCYGLGTTYPRYATGVSCHEKKAYRTFVTIRKEMKCFISVFFVLSVIIWENAGVHADKGYPKKPYGFGYNIDDGYGNTQHRHESADSYDGGVKGSYGYWNADGVYRTVYYTADKTGFRANIKTNEPGTANQNPADVQITAYDPPPPKYPPPPPKYPAPAKYAPAYPVPAYPDPPKYPQPKYPQPSYPKSYSYFHKYVPKYSKYPLPAYPQPKYPAASYPQPQYSSPSYPQPKYPPQPAYPQP
ncbi:hypothetical protein AVEN_11633-1, partial [Araneus ventricosus]